MAAIMRAVAGPAALLPHRQKESVLLFAGLPLAGLLWQGVSPHRSSEECVSVLAKEVDWLKYQYKGRGSP